MREDGRVALWSPCLWQHVNQKLATGIDAIKGAHADFPPRGKGFTDASGVGAFPGTEEGQEAHDDTGIRKRVRDSPVPIEAGAVRSACVQDTEAHRLVPVDQVLCSP